MSSTGVRIKRPPKPGAKKRKRAGYITGNHVSPKCATPIEYRSSWELEVCLFLDYSDDVEAYAYEAIAITYSTGRNKTKIKRYFPDFFVKYKDGRKVIIEVKREDKLNNLVVRNKAEAARAWGVQNGFEYEFWTDVLIKRLKVINQARKAARNGKDDK